MASCPPQAGIKIILGYIEGMKTVKNISKEETGIKGIDAAISCFLYSKPRGWGVCWDMR